MNDDPSIDFEAPVKERIGGDELSIYLAFTPTDIKNLSTTHFKSYLVNDSNYYIHFSYAVKDREDWNLRAVGELEPNMKLLIEDFTIADLNDMLHGCVQFHAYKNKPFKLKPTCDIQVNIDAVKFYKLNTFHENVFFEQPALIYTLVEKDKLALRPMFEPLIKKTEDTVVERLKTGYDTLDSHVDDAIQKRADELAKRYKVEYKKPAKQILNNDKIIVDLHSEELLETTAGMSSADILEYQLDVFRRTLEQYKAQRGKKIIFIHGKGEGVLRHAIIHELNYKYKHYSYQDASFREYGYGATQITIK